MNALLYDRHLYNDRLQRSDPLVRVLMVGVWERRMELVVQQLMLYSQLLRLLAQPVDVVANAGMNVLVLPPPDDDGRGWLPSPGLPGPDSTPSFGHPIHTDDTTKRHTPDLQLFGDWSLDYMSTMACNFKSEFYPKILAYFSLPVFWRILITKLHSEIYNTS